MTNTEETNESENRLPSATAQIAGGVIGVAAIAIGLRTTVVAIKRARANRKDRILWTEAIQEDLDA